jgi:alcohol dehydrogenase class IV
LDGKSIPEIGTAVKRALQAFYQDCGVPTLKELGMNLSEIKEIVYHSLSGIWYVFAPEKPSEEEMTQWLEEAYKG